MDIYTKLRRLPYEVETYSDEVYAYLKFEGRFFEGWANCHPDDLDFQSEKVGTNIALSRARLKALDAYKDKLRQELALYRRFVYECHHSPEAKEAYNKAKARLDDTYSAIRKEKSWLRRYIQDQDKMISIIKRLRAQEDKDN